MSVTISIRFLSGRAHLHPWQTHHSEGRVEWPPSPWRLLRALVAVAGRGLTSLPYPDDIPPLKHEAVVNVEGMAKPKERGVPPETKKKLSFSKPKQTLTLKEPLTDAEVDAWKAANPGEEFAAVLDQLQELAAASDSVAMGDFDSDEIPLSRLAELLHELSATPTIWLPKTSGGHTRQYFPIHSGGIVKNTGSAVFDTFATVRKDQPLLFHWSNSNLSEQQLDDLRLLLSRMTYFGRAESWCRAEAHVCPMEKITAEGMSEIAPEKVQAQTHWECRCIEDHGKPAGQEYREYLLERRLTPIADLKKEVPELLPRTNSSDGKKRKQAAADTLKALLTGESSETLLLRCLLRESGQDIKDGLERPIGTRWVHYTVPRAIYDVPRPRPRPRSRTMETVDLVRYALNTATVGRAVLPALTDTLLVADKFRSAVMTLCRHPGQSLSGHEADGSPCKDHQHAFWWPMDEDNDGFIDNVIVWSPGGFEQHEIDALRRLTRLRQRGGRPDLLVTPMYVGQAEAFSPWREVYTTTFVCATPYHCPLSLSHGRRGGGRLRPITRVIREGVRRQGITEEIEEISEIVFDYAPDELMATLEAVAAGTLQEPIHPRQFFASVEPLSTYPPLPRFHETVCDRFQGACLKDPDTGYPFGLSVGLRVDCGERFVRASSFCRRRRKFQAKGDGRMFLIRFCNPRLPRPFAIGDQCHFGLGLFIPVPEHPQLSDKGKVQ
jgi:CRISPR-associated protein Csb2